MSDIKQKAYIGMTGSGKTNAALLHAERSKKPFIIINPKDDDIPGLIRVDGNSIDGATMKRYLQKGININYIPSNNRKFAINTELPYIVDILFNMGNVIIIFDEAEKYGYEGLHYSPLIDVAERGRSKRVEGYFLSQYPANLSKTILSQCDLKYYFRFDEYGARYLSQFYNTGEIIKMLETKGPYSYIIIENGEIRGVFRENERRGKGKISARQ